jgi:hypothetical protein
VEAERRAARRQGAWPRRPVASADRHRYKHDSRMITVLVIGVALGVIYGIAYVVVREILK